MAYEEIVSTHFPEMKKNLEERLSKSGNPYQPIYENENYGFDDKEKEDVFGSANEEEDEDSFELGD